MSLLFSNYLNEGYYELDDYDSFTKLENVSDIIKAQKNGTLYVNDGICTTKVHKEDKLDDITRRNNKSC